MNVGEKEVPRNAVYDEVKPFSWDELHGKVVVLTVGKDSGCTVVCATDEEGVTYVLHEEHERAGLPTAHL